MSDIPESIRRLPVPDRVALATKIWESVAEDAAQGGLSDEHRRILDERIREADEDSDALVPADEVFRELMNEK